MTKLTALIEAAKAATPGPWHSNHYDHLIVDDGEGSSQTLVTTVALNTYKDRSRHNKNFIALSNLATILELCALLEKAEHALKQYATMMPLWEAGIEALVAIKQWKEKT